MKSARVSLLCLVSLLALDGFDAQRRAADAVAAHACCTAATEFIVTTHRALIAAVHAQRI